MSVEAQGADPSGVDVDHVGRADRRTSVDDVNWFIAVAATIRSARRASAARVEVSAPWYLGAGLVVAVVVGGALTAAIPWATAGAIVVLVPAALVDVRHRRLPNPIVLAAGTAFVGLSWLESALSPTGGPAWSAVAVGGLSMAAPLLAVHVCSPDAMGFGDVKAAAVLGAAVGAIDARLGIVALALAAGTGAVVGVSTGRRTIPFGPALVAAAAAAAIFHTRLVPDTTPMVIDVVAHMQEHV